MTGLNYRASVYFTLTTLDSSQTVITFKRGSNLFIRIDQPSHRKLSRYGNDISPMISTENNVPNG